MALYSLFVLLFIKYTKSYAEAYYDTQTNACSPFSVYVVNNFQYLLLVEVSYHSERRMVAPLNLDVRYAGTPFEGKAYHRLIHRKS